jgi:hypothetical protein
MKPVPSSFSAAVYSLGNARRSAAEAFLPQDGLVIVIQDNGEKTAGLFPIQCSNLPNYRVDVDALPATGNATKSYFAYPTSAAKASIDVIA